MIDHLDEMIFRAGHLEDVEKRIREILGGEVKVAHAEKETFTKELRSIEKQMESTFRLYNEVQNDSELVSTVKEKLRKLTERKRELLARQETAVLVSEKNEDAKEARSVIENRARNFKKGWPKATPQIKKRLIRAVILKMIYSPQGILTEYQTAKEDTAFIQSQLNKKASENFSEASSNVLLLSKRRPTRSYVSDSAPIVRFGGADPTTDAPASADDKYHDIIPFFVKTKQSNFSICAPLYAKGASIREITKLTGIPKSSVREALQNGGVTLRCFINSKRRGPQKPNSMRSGVIPYGYAYLEGELVKNPAEYKIVLEMMRLWTKGKSFHAITKILNEQNTPTRLGKKWTHSVVRKIIKRQHKCSK